MAKPADCQPTHFATYIFISQKDELVFISKLIQSICAAAIETMGTYPVGRPIASKGEDVKISPG